MISRRFSMFSKFSTINAMALAVVAATALSARADVVIDDPAQVFPNGNPATWNNTDTIAIAPNSDQSASVTLNNVSST